MQGQGRSFPLTWPKVRPSAEEATPSSASVVASPNAKLSALRCTPAALCGMQFRAAKKIYLQQYHGLQLPGR